MRTALIRVLWFGLVPALLTALTLRYLVGDVGQPVVAAGAIFLGFSSLAGYWSPFADSARLRPLLVVLAVALAAAAALAFALVYRPARIDSTSMLPTLLPGDRIWTERLAYSGATPQRGDVIVFHRDGGGEGGELVKRVVGVPGDHVTMRDSLPVINGKPVDSCDAGTFVYFSESRFSRGRLVVEWLDGQPYLSVHDHGPQVFAGYVVKPGEVFVLGDNRGVSNDSRSWPAPGVAFAAIEGRVRRVLFGADRRGQLDVDRAWARLGTELHLVGVDLGPLRAGIGRCVDGSAPH